MFLRAKGSLGADKGASDLQMVAPPPPTAFCWQWSKTPGDPPWALSATFTPGLSQLRVTEASAPENRLVFAFWEVLC